MTLCFHRVDALTRRIIKARAGHGTKWFNHLARRVKSGSRLGKCYSGQVSDEGMSADGALGRPEHGARIVVRLVSGSAADAAYEVVLAAPVVTWSTSATVRESDGQVELGSYAPEPPPPVWLTQAAH